MAHIGPDDARCSMCGTALGEGARFCPQCGNALEETRRLDVPPRGREQVARTRTKASESRSERRSAASLTFVAFVAALFLTVLFSSLGQLLVGVLLAPVTLALGVVWASTAWERLEGDAGPAFRRAVTNLGSVTRVVRAFVVNWSRAGRTELRLRVMQRRLRRQQEGLLRSLGEAVFLGDARRADALKQMAVANADQIEQCGTELQSARRVASERMETERAAAAPTEVLETRNLPGRLGGEQGPDDRAS